MILNAGSVCCLPVHYQYQFPLPLLLHVEFDHALSWPVVGNSTGAPVQDDGTVLNGQKVRPRVTNLKGTAVLHQSNRKIICARVCICVGLEM